MDKSTFTGIITSIQPRIRLTRSFDEASHTYLGYAVKIAGTIDKQETISSNQTTFSIGIAIGSGSLSGKGTPETTRIYDSKCSSCIWGARMPAEIIVDNWNPRGKREYRVETFCYGPTEHRDPDE